MTEFPSNDWSRKYFLSEQLCTKQSLKSGKFATIKEHSKARHQAIFFFVFFKIYFKPNFFRRRTFFNTFENLNLKFALESAFSFSSLSSHLSLFEKIKKKKRLLRVLSAQIFTNSTKNRFHQFLSHFVQIRDIVSCLFLQLPTFGATTR